MYKPHEFAISVLFLTKYVSEPNETNLSPTATASKYNLYFSTLEHSWGLKRWAFLLKITLDLLYVTFYGRETVNLHLGTLKCDWAAFFILHSSFYRHHNIDIPVLIPTYFSKTVSNCKLRFLSKLLSKIELAVLLYLEDPSENNTEWNR